MTIGNLTLIGLGHLKPDVLVQLKQILEDFEKQKVQYKNEPNYSCTPVVKAMITSIRHYVSHLERLPMTYRELKFIFCEAQCHMLEFMALLKYLTNV